MKRDLHTLASIDENPDGAARYICSCGARGRFVRAIVTLVAFEGANNAKGSKPTVIASADERARGAHTWHATLANDSTRPSDWGNT